LGGNRVIGGNVAQGEKAGDRRQETEFRTYGMA